MKTVNPNGLSVIKQFLLDHLRRPELVNDEVVGHYATKIEDSILEGNGAQFEIRSFKTLSQRPEICRLSDDCIE